MPDSKYWDKASAVEPRVPQGVQERYTQMQCATACLRGIRHLPAYEPIRMLQTDMWAEGTARHRAVVSLVLAQARSRGYMVESHGIDISRLTCIGARDSQATVSQAACQSLPFQTSSFDLVFDPSTSDHLPWSEATKAWHEYYRVLAPGGILVLIFAHRSGTLAGGPGLGESYWTFGTRNVRTFLRYACGMEVLHEYAIHVMNTPPMGALRMYGLFQRLEYSLFSRLMAPMAPLYVMIVRA